MDGLRNDRLAMANEQLSVSNLNELTKKSENAPSCHSGESRNPVIFK
jgi:hypothetical protein